MPIVAAESRPPARRQRRLLLAALTAALAAAPARAVWEVAWEDNFDGPAGAAPDATKWTVRSKPGIAANGELQQYTPANVALDGAGHLVIESRLENASGKAYTSGWLDTSRKANWTFARIDIVAKLPFGQGSWPAYWTLPDWDNATCWPRSGEIDIMEHLNYERRINGAVHYANASKTGCWGAVELSGGGWSGTLPEAFWASWHTYGMVWDQATDRISISFDGATFASVPGASTKFPALPRYLILNTAIGGWPGSPNATTPWPLQHVVDRVSVYRSVSASPTASASATPSPAVAAFQPAGTVLLLRGGDGSAALAVDGVGVPLTLEEHVSDGSRPPGGSTLVGLTPLPTAAPPASAGGGYACTASYWATGLPPDESFPSLTADGAAVLVPCNAWAVGVAVPAAGGDAGRVVAVVGGDGGVDTTTRATGWLTGGNQRGFFRTAAAASLSQGIYVGGYQGGGGANDLRRVAFGSAATAAYIGTPSIYLRYAATGTDPVTGGARLLFTSAAGPAVGVGAFNGSGLPTATSGTALLPGFAAYGNTSVFAPRGFVAEAPGRLWVANDAPASSVNVLLFTFDDAAPGAWALARSVTLAPGVTGVRSVAGRAEGPSFIVYAANRAAAWRYDTSVAAGAATLLVTAAPNTLFFGVVVPPAAGPGMVPATPLVTATPSQTGSASRTGSATPSRSATGSRSPTPTRTPSGTGTASRTRTGSATGSATPTRTGSATASRSLTGSSCATASGTNSAGATHTGTPSWTPSGSGSGSTTGTPTRTPPPSATPSGSATGSVSGSASVSASPSASGAPTGTGTGTGAGTGSGTGTASSSLPPSASGTAAATATATGTASPRATTSATPPASPSPPPSDSGTRSRAATRSGSRSPTPSGTGSGTRTGSRTRSRTPSRSRASRSPSPTRSRSATQSRSRTRKPKR